MPSSSDMVHRAIKVGSSCTITLAGNCRSFRSALAKLFCRDASFVGRSIVDTHLGKPMDGSMMVCTLTWKGRWLTWGSSTLPAIYSVTSHLILPGGRSLSTAMSTWMSSGKSGRACT